MTEFKKTLQEDKKNMETIKKLFFLLDEMIGEEQVKILKKIDKDSRTVFIEKTKIKELYNAIDHISYIRRNIVLEELTPETEIKSPKGDACSDDILLHAGVYGYGTNSVLKVDGILLDELNIRRNYLILEEIKKIKYKIINLIPKEKLDKLFY